MPIASPYIAGCEDHEDEVWRRHSDDPHAGPIYCTDRKSASSGHNMPNTSDSKQRKHALQHRLSASSLQSRPSSTSTASLSSSTSSARTFRPWSSAGSIASSSTSSAAFRPWSSAGSTASSAADDSSGSPLTTTSVRFLGVSKKEAHCVYLVQVDTGAEQFVVQKRYSQFRDFRQQLFAMLASAQHCGHGPCKQLLQLTQLKFPRRRPLLAQWKKDADLTLARERLLLLQRFVEAMLRIYRMAPKRQLRCCVNMQCAAMETVCTFLQIAAVPDSDNTLTVRTSMGFVAPELVQVRRSSLSPEQDVDDKNAAFESSRHLTRGFPPQTRASLPPTEEDHQFEQLYTITEDHELMHLHT